MPTVNDMKTARAIICFWNRVDMIASIPNSTTALETWPEGKMSPPAKTVYALCV
jgi:hypothetical protein